MKRLLALVLALALCTTLLPIAALATELSGEETPEKLLSIGEDEDGDLTFETFEDLKELASRTYEESITASYLGSGSLVIEEDLTLPENLEVFVDGHTVVVPEGVTLTASYPNNFDRLSAM